MRLLRSTFLCHSKLLLSGQASVGHTLAFPRSHPCCSVAHQHGSASECMPVLIFFSRKSFLFFLCLSKSYLSFKLQIKSLDVSPHPCSSFCDFSFLWVTGPISLSALSFFRGGDFSDLSLQSSWCLERALNIGGASMNTESLGVAPGDKFSDGGKPCLGEYCPYLYTEWYR